LAGGGIKGTITAHSHMAKTTSAQRLSVGILGATGMVGQRFVSLLENHPWFEVRAVAASKNSAGKTYAEAVDGRWKYPSPIPSGVRDLVVLSVRTMWRK